MPNYYIRGDNKFGDADRTFYLQINGDNRLLLNARRRDADVVLQMGGDGGWEDTYAPVPDMDDFQALVDEAFPGNDVSIINMFISDMYEVNTLSPDDSSGELIRMSFTDINGIKYDKVLVLADTLRQIGKNLILGFRTDGDMFKFFITRPDDITSMSG